MSTRLTRPHLWVVTVVMGAMVILGAPPSVRAQDNKAALKVDPFFGGLQQQVPIEVPAFRGLEPRLALAYSSSAGNGLAGVGWTLTGVGAIERGQKGRGAPNYDGADVFFLDGQELVPCVGGMISPSCTTCPAGYTCYATRIEGFQRIGYRASDDTWALWEKDGTRVSFAPTHRASTPSQSCTSNTVSGSSGAWSGWSGYYLTDLGGSGTALSATRYGEYGNESKAMTIGGAAMSSGGWSGWSGYYLTDVTASGNTLTVQRYGEYGNETRTIYLGGNITATDGGWSGWSGYYVTDIAVSGTAITLTRAGEYGNETKTISLSNVVCTPTQTALGTFRWGQQSVADTSGNTVNYAWWCDGNPHLACYPDTVSYNGTTVRFWREARPDPHNFSTGSGTVGRQSYRLRSIDVTVSGSRARAYKLGYTTAPSTGRSTLASVQQFGRDATVDGAGGVSGGTALPANSFGYDGLAPATTTCRLDSAVVSGGMASNWGECTPYLHAVSASGNAITFSSGCGSGAVTLNNVTVSGGLAQSWGECTPWVYQVTASGNQLTFHTNCGTGTVTLSGATVSGGFSPGWGECTPYVDSVTASGNTITFNSNCGAGAVTVESTNTCASSPHANSTYDGHGSGGHGDSFADLDGDGDNEYVTRNNFTHYVTTYGPTGVTNQTFTGCHGVGAHGWTYTDVDGDGKQEYVTRTSSTHYITRYVGGACVSQTFTGGHGVGSHGWTYADIDGDGKQEYVTRTGGTHYITRYTATGLTNQTFTNCHGVGSTGWSYADVDGDGKQEYVTHSSGTFYISRYGATGCVNQTFTGGFGVGSDGWTFADVDGDGKQEYVTRNGGTHLVTRFTARGLLNQTITGCHGLGSDGWTYADVDGDGQSDYLTRTGSTHYRSRYTATGCVNESFLAHGSGTTGSTWVDIDGDRRADYVARSGGKHYVTRYGWRPDTLTSVTGMFGSTSTIAYKPATAWPNTNAVPASPTVASITTSDGRGTSSTTNYAYQGGLWSATERRFLGFRKVTTVVDAAGNYTETYYHQHVGCIAKPEATYFRNAAGQIFTYSSYSYAENAAPPYTSLLTQRWDYECNLDASCRRLVTTLGYDTYGNVTASYEYGDYDVAGDERTTTRGYYPNTAAYITGHPAYENVHAGIGTGGALKRQTLNTYDGGTTYAAAPGSRGLLTRRQRWLDQTGGYATRSFAYDAWGNRTSETDEVGATQTFTFDSTYRMYRTRRCDALNHCQATTYDVVLGGVTSDTDPNSKTHSRTYDALGRLATETPPMGGTIQYQYLSWGSPTAQRIRQILPDGSADGLWAEQYLDGAGRTYRWVREGGLERSQLFFGLTTRTWKLSAWYAPASGPPTYQVYAYDGAGRMVRSTNPDGTFAEVSYGDGYVVRTNEVGDVRTEYQDGSGQIGRVVEWDGTTSRSTSYNRDALGRLVSTVDSAGATSTSTWDSLDRRIATCDPDLGCWSYGYDLAGRQTSSTDARGVTLTMTYDAGGRPLRRTRPDGTAVVWTYDEAGHGDGKGDRPTTVTWATGSDSFTYDATGRVTRNTRCVLGQCRTTSWTYDALGRQTTVTYGDGEVVTTTYDSAGRLASVPGYVTSAAWNPRDQLTAMTFANGTVQTYGYSATRGWLTSSLVTGSTALYQVNYNYDAAGRVISTASMTDSSHNSGFTYDRLGRLTAVGGAQAESFTYSPTGNIASSTTLGAYTYGSSKVHAVTATAVTGAYAYDANGNLTSGGGRTLTWDADNRLASVTSGSGTSTYSYDPDGQRIARQTAAGTTRFYGKLLEVAPDGTVTKHVYAGPMVVARKSTAGTFWMHQDRLGSIKLLTSATGTPARHYTYSAFGRTTATTGTAPNVRGYGGHEADADTGLVYMNARYYDPALGRFISPDTVIPDPHNPQALNRYAYAYNNPISNIDPTGHVPVVAAVLAAVAAVGTEYFVVAVIGAAITTVGYLADDPVLMTIGGILSGFAGGANGLLLGGGTAGGVLGASVAALTSPLSPLDPSIKRAIGWTYAAASFAAAQNAANAELDSLDAFSAAQCQAESGCAAALVGQQNPTSARMAAYAASEKTGLSMTEILQKAQVPGTDFYNTAFGLVGPGPGMMTKVLEATVGWIPSIRLHGIIHDGFGLVYNAFKIGPGYNYSGPSFFGLGNGNMLAGQVEGLYRNGTFTIFGGLKIDTRREGRP